MDSFRPVSPELPWRTAAVRDLAWLLLGPAPWLVGPQTLRARLLGPTGLAQLTALDQQPDALLAWLARTPSSRLGHYAEQLLAFWFQQAPHIALLAHNRVLRDQRHTIGEFDFLLSLDGQPWHVEACSKFYLQLPSADLLVGPSLRDAWCLKAAKLQQQLTLSRHTAARLVLPPDFLSCQIGALVSGCFFYWQAPACSESAPAGQWQGWLADMAQPWPCQDSDSRWCWLPRLRWLSPARVPPAAALTADQLRRQWQGVAVPQMVAELRPDEMGWHEVSRGMVIPAGWPAAERLATLRVQVAAIGG